MKPLAPLLLALGLLLASPGGIAQQAASQPVISVHPAAPPRAPASLSRGEYLSRLGGCFGCHTEPKHGKPFAGGRVVPTPFGGVVSTNITPDPVHGIGRWSFEEFQRAMREGTSPGDRHLYPAMPYVSYSKASEADLRDLYAYLQGAVPAVPEPTPPNDLPFPINQRILLAPWKFLFVPRERYEPRPAQSAEWNRGAYLVQGFGHCGACHTPRGPAFQERGLDERARHYLQGQTNDLWFASNLRGDDGDGLGRLTAADLATFLRTGHAAGLAAFGTMTQEIEDGLQYLHEEDLQAIATYLKSLAPAKTPARYQPRDAVDPPPEKGNKLGDVETPGAAVYRGFCASCHQASGMGVPQVVPRLAGSPAVMAVDPSGLIRLVVEGGRSPQTRTGPEPQSMPGFAGTLSDVQIAQVLSYLRQSWGNDAKAVKPDEVSGVRAKLKR